jgi:hypothetical protein
MRKISPWALCFQHQGYWRECVNLPLKQAFLAVFVLAD